MTIGDVGATVSSDNSGGGRGLAGGAVRGAGWNVLTFGLSKGLLLLTTVVLTRLLDPEDFGLLALGMLVLLFLEVIGDLGVGAALIYRRDADERSISTAAVVAAATGTVLTVGCLLSAPLVARLFDEPRLTGVVQVLALALFLRTLSAVHRAMLEKELDFARRAVPEVLGAVTKASLSVGLALAGAGVYSLAWGQVGGVAVTTVLYWVLARWRFRPALDLSTVKELLRFGLPVTVLALLAAVTQSLDQFVIGRRLDATALGQYSIAYRLPELFILYFCYLLSGSLFPSYVKASHDPDQLRRGFQLTLRMVSLVTVPLALGLAVTAGDVVPVLFGDQWEEAVPVLRWLSIATLLTSLSFNVGDVYKATGRPGVLNRMAALRLVVSLPVLWLVAPAGIAAVAAALAGLLAANTLLQLVVASRLMRLPMATLLSEFAPALVSGAVMVAVLVPTSGLLREVSSTARLALLVVLGAVAYVAVLTLVSRSTVVRVIQLLRAARSTPGRPATPCARVGAS